MKKNVNAQTLQYLEEKDAALNEALRICDDPKERKMEEAPSPRHYAPHPLYAAADIRAVFSKVDAHIRKTGASIFFQIYYDLVRHLRDDVDAGISADLLQAAALGRLEAEAYFSHLCRLLPPSIFVAEYWDELDDITRLFQYREIQTVIDDHIAGGMTMTRNQRKSPKPSATAPLMRRPLPKNDICTIALEALSSKTAARIYALRAEGHDWDYIAALEGITISSVQSLHRRAASAATAMRCIVLHAEGHDWDYIAALEGITIDTAECGSRRACKKLEALGIDVFLQK